MSGRRQAPLKADPSVAQVRVTTLNGAACVTLDGASPRGFYDRLRLLHVFTYVAERTRIHGAAVTVCVVPLQVPAKRGCCICRGSTRDWGVTKSPLILPKRTPVFRRHRTLHPHRFLAASLRIPHASMCVRSL